MPHGKLLIGFQHWWGDYGNVSLNTGAFPPAIFPAALPTASDDEGVPMMTDFLITQPLSEKLVVFAGKKNVIGTADQDIFAGGDGTDQFMNQAWLPIQHFCWRCPTPRSRPASRCPLSLVLRARPARRKPRPPICEMPSRASRQGPFRDPKWCSSLRIFLRPYLARRQDMGKPSNGLPRQVPRVEWRVAITRFLKQSASWSSRPRSSPASLMDRLYAQL